MHSNFNLHQYYFDEHLLRLYPDKPLGIVEAEKTDTLSNSYLLVNKVPRNLSTNRKNIPKFARGAKRNW